MKQLLTITLFIFSFLIPTCVDGQCPVLPVLLDDQIKVDNYKIDFPDCVSSGNGHIEIFGPNIINLNGLLGIEQFFEIEIDSASNLISLDGLDSLKNIDFLILVHNTNLSDINAISSIDSIFALDVTFNEHIQHLDVLTDVKSINDMYLRGDGYFDNWNSRPLQNSLFIGDNNFSNNLQNIFDPETNHILHLVVNNTPNITFEGISDIDSIGYLTVSRNDQIALRGLDKLKYVRHLRFSNNDFSNISKGDVFSSLNTIGSFRFSENANLTSFTDYFPALDSLQGSIYILENPDLENMQLFDWFEAPREAITSMPYTDSKVIIRDNPNLDNCASYFLCKSLEFFPDSVFIDTNSLTCNIDDILPHCDDIVSSTELVDLDISVYPNPTQKIIYIENVENLKHATAELYDIHGSLLISINLRNDIRSTSIDISQLPAAIYRMNINADKQMLHTSTIIKQ